MRQRRLMNQINVVPYIDVMLVLLVIFMVTAPMLPSGTVDVPSVAKASQGRQDPMLVIVRGENEWSLQDRATEREASRVTAGELIERLHAAQSTNPERPVVIQADKNIRYDAVMKVMDLLQRNQINRIGLMVQTTGGR